MKVLKKTPAIIKSRITAYIFCLILGAIFILASVGKIGNPENFAKMVYNYKILPLVFINIIAIILPWIELLCAIGMVTWFFRKGSAAILSIMLVVFIVAISIAISKDLNIECGCFSVSGKGRTVGIAILIEDGIMLLMALRVLLLR